MTYIYLLFSAIWLIGLDKYSSAQMILLVVTNFSYCLYLIIARPFKVHINTIFPIIWCGILITVEIFLFYFELYNSTLLSSQKTTITYPLLITISVFMILLIIWSIWRTVTEFMGIWKQFKQT